MCGKILRSDIQTKAVLPQRIIIIIHGKTNKGVASAQTKLSVIMITPNALWHAQLPALIFPHRPLLQPRHSHRR